MIAALRRGVVAVLLAPIHLYRATAVLRQPRCKYYPSCSTYAVDALREHGPLRGTWLAARRLGRCHPWSLGGIDHVPARDDASPRTARPTVRPTVRHPGARDA